MGPRVAAITLRQLLTMTSGLPEDPSGGVDPARSGVDWVRSILREGTVQPAGTGFAYSNSGSHLLAAILRTATGTSVLDYARARLFDPLGIVTRPGAEPMVPHDAATLAAYDRAGFAWPRDPEGINLGYAGIKLTAPDLAKLGQLFLDAGRWQGTQVVPAEWTRAATSAQTTTGGASYGEHYGYQWWVTTAGEHSAYAAEGNGGQLVEVVPDLHLVVVVTTKIEDEQPLNPTLLTALVSDVIVPAVCG